VQKEKTMNLEILRKLSIHKTANDSLFSVLMDCS